ncbi:hypothetical protein BC939DRAFT_528248 [Gamsiella multidivaricata]|uniref:uncharacterized protein n=1 Tax=Gamsiella multidivaricata TaxID=101098 RepID=UPI0022209180|nr:uncharacterized protein BC939DRAFT_528248 [Gamsiella multidivaricata]KAG0355607.1 hypothetical protein BGZ54_001089 [Gamsiella multidivaricata]KAI7825215.1 hypothetical protein BC939DRAFT_528248 [Gamsiella multidivaricata]
MKLLATSLCLLAAVSLAAQAASEQAQTYFGQALQRDETEGTVSEFEYRGAILNQLSLSNSEPKGDGVSAAPEEPSMKEAPAPTTEAPAPPAGEIRVDTPAPPADNTVVESSAEPVAPVAPAPPAISPIAAVTPAPDCTNSENLLKTVISALSDQLELALNLLPIPDVVKQLIKVALTPLINIVVGELRLITPAIARGLSMAVRIINSALKALQTLPPFADAFTAVIDILNKVQNVVDVYVSCPVTGAVAPKGTSKLEVTSCGMTADVYRALVKDSIKSIPASSSDSEPLKQITTGSSAVLELMDKSSIANSNNALLETRPIFVANLLEQYRQELIHLADNDNLKAYAQANLGMVVSLSNALEACVRIAADPVVAAEDYAENYAAVAGEEANKVDE